ncbi:MAG: oligosaccharide flippase family protein, partial [Clostridiales bacterium]|nr:oligosaccharide flippase family protein [Clostridiales bacterium]
MFKSVATVTAFSVMTRMLGFVFKIYMSRTFGAETVGLYQIGMSVLSLLFAFTASGISPILSRRVAELSSR